MAEVTLCETCNGNGTLPIRDPDGHVSGTKWCPSCGGSGQAR